MLATFSSCCCCSCSCCCSSCCCRPPKSIPRHTETPCHLCWCCAGASAQKTAPGCENAMAVKDGKASKLRPKTAQCNFWNPWKKMVLATFSSCCCSCSCCSFCSEDSSRCFLLLLLLLLLLFTTFKRQLRDGKTQWQWVKDGKASKLRPKTAYCNFWNP